MAEAPSGVNLSIDQMEEIIAGIRGIKGVRVNANEGNEVEEVHIMASSNRNAKQIVRDIQSALMVELGYKLDHKKVSIVQTGEQCQPELKQQRLKLVSVSLTSFARQVKAQVELAMGEVHYTGQASGPNVRNGKLRLIAEATCKAIGSYLAVEDNFFVEDVVKHQVAGKSVVTVAVAAMIIKQGESGYVGSVFIDADEREAAVRATLSALNRLLQYLPIDKVF